MRIYYVKRPVAADEKYNSSGRSWRVGEHVAGFEGATYGCINEDGGFAAISVKRTDIGHPFFEFPSDAVEVLT